MTPAEIADRVATIADIANDPASAHADEDRLWFDVLTAIRYKAADPAGLAREALKTCELQFSRWYA